MIEIVSEAMLFYFEDLIRLIKLILFQKSKDKGVSESIEAPICNFFKKTLWYCKNNLNLNNYIQDIIDILFFGATAASLKKSSIICQEMLTSLVNLTEYYPEFLKQVQERLLEILSLALFKKEFSQITQKYILEFDINSGFPAGSISDENISILETAFQMLSIFSFSNHSLDLLCLGISLHYINHHQNSIRAIAISSLCNMLDKSDFFNSHNFGQFSSCILNPNDIIERIINIAILDSDQNIRLCVLNSLACDSFLEVLSYPQYIDFIILALNDESLPNQNTCLNLISRIYLFNPMVIAKSLRQNMVMLLNTLNVSLSSYDLQKESILMVQLFLKHFHSHMQPFFLDTFNSLHYSLMQALDHDSPCYPYVNAVLDALGELFISTGYSMTHQIGLILPLIIESIKRSVVKFQIFSKSCFTPNDFLSIQYNISSTHNYDDDSDINSFRQSLLSCLIKICYYSHSVISPSLGDLDLQNAIFYILRYVLNKNTRILAISFLGTVGGINPLILTKMRNLGHSRSSYFAGMDMSLPDPKFSLEANPNNGSFTVHNTPIDQITYNVIKILLNILSDTTLSQYHSVSLQTIVLILNMLGQNAIQLYNLVFPVLIGLFTKSSSAILETLCHHLIILASLVTHHLRPYLDTIVHNLFILLDLNDLSLTLTIFSLFRTLIDIFRSELNSSLRSLFKIFLRYLDVPSKHLKSKPSHLNSSSNNSISFLNTIVPRTSTLGTNIKLVLIK